MRATSSRIRVVVISGLKPWSEKMEGTIKGSKITSDVVIDIKMVKPVMAAVQKAKSAIEPLLTSSKLVSSFVEAGKNCEILSFRGADMSRPFFVKIKHIT